MGWDWGFEKISLSGGWVSFANKASIIIKMSLTSDHVQ